MSGASETGADWREHISYQALLLGGFSLLAAALLTFGDLVTREPIAARRAEDLQASLSQVLPATIHDNDLLAAPLAMTDDDGEPLVVYRALRGLQVTGVAFRASAVGYAGPIEVLVGIDADGRILGARVLAHAETPGLGDKIEIDRDDWILDFDGRSIGDPPLERWAVAKDDGDFDQFTGATITPRAVVRAIKEALLYFAAHRDTLTASAVVTEPAPEAPRPR